MRRSIVTSIALLAMVACDGRITRGDNGDRADAGGQGADSAAASGLAPSDVRPDAPAVDAGDLGVDVDVGQEAVFRVDTVPNEHVGFVLTFPVGTTGVLMHVDRWDGEAPVLLEVTDGGIGIRTLAVLDQGGPRTFWVRISADEPLTGATLQVIRTPFVDGVMCSDDCARLLQLPIPIDSAVDGYSIKGATFRYQWGRRDMIMFIRHAGMVVIANQMRPFTVGDISQWDGETPGVDRNAPRHASHDRGKDVDITLYGSDGEAPWRSYCTTANDGSGRECLPGSVENYDGFANAIMFGAFYASGRVTRCFLDEELIPHSIAGAEQAVEQGLVASELLPLYSDGVHLQHWPNHDNHIHVRISEAETAVFGLEPFTAP